MSASAANQHDIGGLVLATALAALGCSSGGSSSGADMREDAGKKPTPSADAGGVQDPLPPRVHHVHLNVHDSAEAIAFYEKYFGAKPVRLNGAATALWVEPILLLLDEVDTEFPDTLRVGFE